MTENSKIKTAWLPIILCWLAYTAAYIGRCSYPSNITEIIDTFGVSHADAGLVTTCFFFAYGAGQLINGILCKHYNKKIIIPIALVGSAVINLLIFIGVPFGVIKYLWLLNGVFQSVLWSSFIYLLSVTLNDTDLKTGMVTMSSSLAIGTFMAYGTSSLFALVNFYKFAFVVASVALISSAVVWVIFYKKAFSVENVRCENKAKLDNKRIDSSLLSLIVVLAIFSVANNLIKDGITTWVPSILTEKFNLGNSLSIFLTLFLPILGFFGAKSNVRFNKYVKSFVSMSGIFYLLTAISIFTVIILFKTNLWYLVTLIFALISFFMFGVNNITTSMAPLYMRDKINSGFLAGLLNCFCYIGSTISSYGLGAMADKFGWNGVFYLLLGVAVIPILISIVYAMLSKKRVE